MAESSRIQQADTHPSPEERHLDAGIYPRHCRSCQLVLRLFLIDVQHSFRLCHELVQCSLEVIVHIHVLESVPDKFASCVIRTDCILLIGDHSEIRDSSRH